MDPLTPLAADLVPLSAPETLEHVAHAIVIAFGSNGFVMYPSPPSS